MLNVESTPGRLKAEVPSLKSQVKSVLQVHSVLDTWHFVLVAQAFLPFLPLGGAIGSNGVDGRLLFRVPAGRAAARWGRLGAATNVAGSPRLGVRSRRVDGGRAERSLTEEHGGSHCWLL